MREMTVKMLLNHMWVTTMPLCVCCGATEHFSQECCDMLRMIVSHVCEDWLEQFVLSDMLIEARCQSIECIDST